MNKILKSRVTAILVLLVTIFATVSVLLPAHAATTTVTVAELEMQVNVNLIECSIDRFLNGVQLKSRKYQTLSELIRCELEWLDFSDLVDIDDEDIAFYLQYKEGVI